MHCKVSASDMRAADDIAPRVRTNLFSSGLQLTQNRRVRWSRGKAFGRWSAVLPMQRNWGEIMSLGYFVPSKNRAMLAIIFMGFGLLIGDLARAQEEPTSRDDEGPARTQAAQRESR